VATLFLPGAGGRAEFWQPVANQLGDEIEPVLFDWPGFGETPRDATVASLTDLVPYVLARTEGPVDVVAQSMGGVVALMLALQHPDRVRRIVLAGTSGGFDLSRFGAVDWRAQVRAWQPETPIWFVEDRSDLTAQLATVDAPILLIWGEADPISPPAVGRYLADVLPNARLVTIAGAGHDAPVTHTTEVAATIREHLLATDRDAGR
jgi:pimeloyl-ACP methyl ester carboxylesterase